MRISLFLSTFFLSVGICIGVGLWTNQAVANPQLCQHSETEFRCVKYVKNYDADTITFNIPDVHPLIGKKISVRLRGVDAAELRGKKPCEKEKARMAKKLVENQLKRAKRIDLINASKDKYFRILADVVIDGSSLKDILLKNHLAYPYDGGTKPEINWCSRTPAQDISTKKK